VLWEKGETIHELPTFPGDPDGVADAINDRGQVVGQTGDCISPFHGVLWDHDTVMDLGKLGELQLAPRDINNKGQVVGFAFSPDFTTFLAFLWQNGVATNLGTLPAPLGIASFGFSVNEKGQVVGTSIDEQGDPHAFIWQQGVMTELNDLTPAGSPLFLLFGFSINSRGEIVGSGIQVSTGEEHAYLAVPSNGEVTGESTTSAAPGNSSERPKVVLPENVRKMLHQRMAQRYRIRGLASSPRD